MRALVLAWDPQRPGALPAGVADLAEALAGEGVVSRIVAAGIARQGAGARAALQRVTWVPEAPPVLPATSGYDVPRVLAWNSRGLAAADRLVREERPDVVLAWGWSTAHAAANLRAVHGIAVVARLEALVVARFGGSLPDEASRLIHQIEWWLTYEARRVLTPTGAGRRDLIDAFRLPAGKIDVVPPGASVARRLGTAAPGVGILAPPAGGDARRAKRLAAGLGRSGIAVTLAGAPRPRARNVASGTVDDAFGRSVLVVLDAGAADLVVGALAAGRTVVVADRGPFHEFVHARRSGWRVDPDDVAGAVAVVRRLATDPARRERIAAAARARVRDKHAWHDVAAATAAALRRAVRDEEAWRTEAEQRPEPPLRHLMLASPVLGLAPTRRDG